MEEQIIKILNNYAGQTIEFAIGFEKSVGTLPQQLVKFYESEFKTDVRREKEKYISELEKLVLVHNNTVLLSHLKNMRDELEETK